MEIKLERSFGPMIFFFGTDSEIEEAEKEDQRNRKKLLLAADQVRTGAWNVI